MTVQTKLALDLVREELDVVANATGAIGAEV